MFSKRSKSPFIEASKLSSLIAEDVEITGDVSFTHGIRIDGRVKGHVIGRVGTEQAHALLVLSDKGRIEGQVSCGDAIINGSIVGDLPIAHFLELKSSSQVTGGIRYEQLQMDLGATVNGSLRRAAPEATVSPGAKVVELGGDRVARKSCSATVPPGTDQTFFDTFCGRCQPAMVAWRARVTVSSPAGASLLMTEPAPMVAPSPMVTGATSTLLLPMCTPLPITVRCLLAPS